MLNSPTEYPNALVETLFLSNPAEEELVLDPAFQQKMAEKIVAGVKDFLAALGRRGREELYKFKNPVRKFTGFY
jgi:N-acetylmuramoyl-L-alanine amidase